VAPAGRLREQHDVKWHWVKGHAGDPGNERADAAGQPRGGVGPALTAPVNRRCSASPRAARPPRQRRLQRAQLGIAVVALAPDQADGGGDLGVGVGAPSVAAAQQGAQVVAAAGEQAQEELAFGGQPGAVAVAAEGLRHAADHADLAAAVTVGPAFGGLAGHGGVQRPQREHERSMQALHHLRRRQHLVHAPAVAGAHVHVLDEAQHHARPEAVAHVARQRHDLLVVGAALDHHVDLDRRQAHGMRGLDAGQHVGHREVDVVHAPEDGVVQRIQAHGHPLQPGVLQRLCLARQHRLPLVVSVMSSRSPSGVRSADSICDQVLDVLAQQRLAAGQAQLAHAVGDEDARQRG
jgi:hypothetical protein